MGSKLSTESEPNASELSIQSPTNLNENIQTKQIHYKKIKEFLNKKKDKFDFFYYEFENYIEFCNLGKEVNLKNENWLNLDINQFIQVKYKNKKSFSNLSLCLFNSSNNESRRKSSGNINLSMMVNNKSQQISEIEKFL